MKHNRHFKFFSFITCLFFSLSTHAGLLVEPYLGLNFAPGLKVNGTSYDGDNIPLSLGARLGYTNLGVMAGIDYQRTASIDFENQGDKYDGVDIGLFIGYQLPILLRGYAEYIFSSSLKSGSTEFDEASGTKLGVGFTGLPFLSINLEFKKVSYDKANSVSTNTDYQTYLLSVSLPLNL